MRRLAKASREELECLVARASNGAGVVYTKASYPPGCAPRRGPLRIRSLAVGGLMMEVEPRSLRADNFRLNLLFHKGSCVFGSLDDLARFAHGPLARSFGIAVDHAPASPVGEEPAPAEPVEEPVSEATADPERASRKPPPDDAPAGALSAERLHDRLRRRIRGQDRALDVVARIVSGHLAKVAPARPESLLLVGPTGTGKTAAVSALPEALSGLGHPGAHVFRVDCNELTDDYDAKRFLGAAPGLVGYTDSPPLVKALGEPGCIVLLDEIEKAHEDIRTAFIGLLDEGRVTTPNGTSIAAPRTIVVMTSNLGASDLAYALRDAPDHERYRRPICRDHLLRMGWPTELVGRIGAFAVFEELRDDALHEIAGDAIRLLGREYGLAIRNVPGVLADVVLDLAGEGDVGARALTYAARDLLGEAFAGAARSGVGGRVTLDPGPPPVVVATGTASRAR